MRSEIACLLLRRGIPSCGVTDHDLLFKHLLQNFFREFLAAFLPELERDLEPSSIQFLDKELIRARGRRRRMKLVDLVARVRFRGEESFVLVHVEHQAHRTADIGRRLFLYAAWLMDRYELPVYPVLLTSYEQPRSPEPDRFVLEVRGLRVVDFRFRVVQLNRLDWRDYAGVSNPATAALMARMKIQGPDRAKVKLQILRLLATLRLEPDKMDLIAGFMETYLELSAKEELLFQRELDKVQSNEQKASVMELMTSWERKGRQEGRLEGRQEGRLEGQLDLIRIQLNRRLGVLTPATVKRLNTLSTERLTRLAEALLDFKSAADLERWLARGRAGKQKPKG